MTVIQDHVSLGDADEVAQHRPATRWSVEDSAWKLLLPDLPADVAALLAAPVVVSADDMVSFRSHPVGGEEDEPLGPPPTDPCAGWRRAHAG